MARAYTTTLSSSDQWSSIGLEIASIPPAFVSSYSVMDLVGSLGLEATTVRDFANINEVRDDLVEHFAEPFGLSELVGEALDQPFLILEESPGRARPMSAVAGAGALATGFAVFGPWAIIAVPAGVFLLAAPQAGEGFGAWVGSWFRRRVGQI